MRLIPVGFLCNNACVFCAQGSLRVGDPGPQDARVRALLDSALGPRERDRAVAFVGGEPTLHEGLAGWVAEARRLKARWSLVQTNGRRLAYAGYAASLAASGLHALDVSLHGTTAAMHDYHTGVEGSCAQTLLGLRRAREAGLRVGVTTVVTRSNFRHLSEVVGLAAAHGAAAVHLDLAVARGKALAAWARVVPAPELVTEHLAAAVRAARAAGLDVLVGGRSTSSGARRLFAGLGETEAPPAEAAAPRARVAVPGARVKPAPGAREVHGAGKKTGVELKTIFPGLFKAAPETPSGAPRG